MTKDETKANEEVIAKNGVKAMLFDDVQRLILRQYTEVFPNYVWTDYMAAIDVMAAEVKVLRSELLDALSLVMAAEVANAGRTSYRTDAEWDMWKKICARLEALLLEVRGRHYAATLPAALGLTDSAEGPIQCGTFSEKAEPEQKLQHVAEGAHAAPYVCDHDYCDLEECTCKCHQDTADAAVREIAVREIMT